MLVCIWIFSTVVQIICGADNNERVLLLNSVQYLDIDKDFSIMQVDEYINNNIRMSGYFYMKPDEPIWTGVPDYHTGTTSNWIDFPTIYFYPQNFKGNNTGTPVMYVYFCLVLKSDVEQITPFTYNIMYDIDLNAGTGTGTSTIVSYTDSEYTFLIHAIGHYSTKLTSAVYINELRYQLPTDANPLILMLLVVLLVIL